jgi:hypothetical protein
MRIQNSPEVEARRAAATSAFVERRHALFHEYNGDDAACERCGTDRMPAWMRRRTAKDLTGAGR